MKTTKLLLLAAISAIISSCAGHSITYNGSYGRYTFDRTGLIDIEPYHEIYVDPETCK